MQKYKVGTYLRLSKDDFDNKESNSISNQKEVINNYIKSNKDFVIVDYYTTVIVKDLSRLGRNHIEVDNYLENIFPLYNIRFISVTESIDVNEKCVSLDNIAIPIKSLINDLYAKDISDKVRITLEAKKRNGEFIGVSAPYGYIKDPKDKHKFIIDIESSYIVTKIFNMVLLGKSRKEIAEHLNNKWVLTPSLYKLQKEKINNTKNVVTNKWNAEIVTRILRNETYTGTLIQGVKKKLNYRTNKIIDVDKDNWIITENHHEPIIKKDKYNEVQKILDIKVKVNKNNEIDLFSGFFRCRDCDNTLFMKKSKGYIYYYCSIYAKNKSCTKHVVNRQSLEEKVLKEIKQKYNEITILDREVLNKLIDIIYIFEDKRIEIKFKS